MFGVAANIALLGYYKYAVFILDQFSAAGLLGELVLPVGISFYTFNQIVYLADLSRRPGAAEREPVTYALFVTWFPHLIAGPILHHREMIPQLRSALSRPPRWSSIMLGLGIFAIGLAKKVLLADQVAPFVDVVFSRAVLVPLTFCEAWIGALAYTLQIYFDFSGYSDMAIGLSFMFGVRLPVNFNSPYKAASIIEFWRRWHMTLSRFLRDYVYIPLGGNRHGAGWRHVNLLLTMLIGGLWHGAGWTFLIWGGLHGVYLILNHLWRTAGIPVPRPVAVIITFLAVVIAWVVFRAENVHAALAVLAPMLLSDGLSLAAPLRNGIVPALPAALTLTGLLAIALVMPNSQQMFRRARSVLLRGEKPAHLPAGLGWLEWRPDWRWGVALGILLAAGFARLGGLSPFLYFRF